MIEQKQKKKLMFSCLLGKEEEIERKLLPISIFSSFSFNFFYRYINAHRLASNEDKFLFYIHIYLDCGNWKIKYRLRKDFPSYFFLHFI